MPEFIQKNLKFAIPALLGLSVAAGAGGYFFYELFQLTLGPSGTKYARKLPKAPPVSAKDAAQCRSDYAMAWIGCRM